MHLGLGMYLGLGFIGSTMNSGEPLSTVHMQRE